MDKLNNREVDELVELGLIVKETKGPSGILGDVNGQQPHLGLSHE